MRIKYKLIAYHAYTYEGVPQISCYYNKNFKRKKWITKYMECIKNRYILYKEYRELPFSLRIILDMKKPLPKRKNWVCACGKSTTHENRNWRCGYDFIDVSWDKLKIIEVME